MATAAAQFAATRTYGRVWSTFLLAGDCTIIAFAAFICERAGTVPGPVLFWAAVATLALLALSGTYRRSFSGSMRDEWYAVGAAIALVVTLLVIATFLAPALWNGRPEILAFGSIAFAGVAATRTLAHSSRVPRRIAIVGAPERVDIAIVHLHPRRDDALLRLPVGDIDATLAEPHDLPPWLRGAIAWGATRIIVTEAMPPEHLLRLINASARFGTELAFAPTRFRPQSYAMHLERDGGLMLLCPRPLPVCTKTAAAFKRSFDLALTIPALVLLAPIMLVVALAVKLDTPGPVIYRQVRTGRGGRSFEMLKFRSMPVDAEAASGPMWADPTLQRATRVGRILRRLSLDELPQLMNVVRGEMSLVGPRPERPYFVEQFRRKIPRYDERHLVAPGISGWSQISMPRILGTDDVKIKLEGDLFYLEEWSPLLDTQIIVKTLFEFLFQRVA